MNNSPFQYTELVTKTVGYKTKTNSSGAVFYKFKKICCSKTDLALCVHINSS